MPPKIENEIEDLAAKMEKSIQDPREVLKAAIAALGPAELKKALTTLTPAELDLVKSSLEADLLAKGGPGSGIRGHQTAETPTSADPHAAQKISMFSDALSAKKKVHAQYKKEKPDYKAGNPNHDMTEASIGKMTSKLKEMKTMKKAVEFDKEAQAVKYVKGNINDTILQEDKVDDDADEKLVKPEAAKMDHQGTPTPGWEGQVVKGEKPMDKKEIKAIADKEAAEEVKEHESKMHAKKEKEMEKGYAAKSEEKEEKCMEPMAKKEGAEEKDEAEGEEGKKAPKAKLMDKLRAMKKALETELGAEASPELIKGKMKAMMQEMEADEKEEKDESKEKPEPKKEEKKESKPEMKKAIWEEPNALLKAMTGGRNHHFNVNGYYDEVLKQAASPLDEKLTKSGNFPTPKEDLNEIIAKGQDTTWGALETDRLVKSSARTGSLIKSFEQNEIAAALGLTEEEARKLLGEE